LRKGDMVTGVTTAATLWATTVIGLCFGGGQIELGIAGTTLALITLWALHSLDVRIPREHHATLVIKSEHNAAAALNFANLMASTGIKAKFHRQSRADDEQQVRLSFDISWRRPEVDGPPLDILKFVNEHYPVVSFELISEPHH